MHTESSPSGVNVVLVMAYGSLVFVLLFIFLQRQIMRYVMKSHRRPHTPVGHNAPKQLREMIKSLLSDEFYSRREPRLLFHDDVRLKHRVCSNHLYRMQALDATKDAGIVATDLLLHDSHSLNKSSHTSLIDQLLEGYHNARHGTGVFGEAEFLKYKEHLAELAANIKVHSSTSSMNQHQTAAKALMSSIGPSTASTSQVTDLPSSPSQRSKRTKHFLELRNFKDSCNTLKSTVLELRSDKC